MVVYLFLSVPDLNLSNPSIFYSRKVFTKKKYSSDNLLLLTEESLESLADLPHLTTLHLTGFAGRQNRVNYYYFSKLDTAISTIAKRGKLEEFVFSQSGATYKAVFDILRFCRNIRYMLL